MLAHMCIFSVFVSQFTFPYIVSSEWALKQTELSCQLFNISMFPLFCRTEPANPHIG